MIDSLFLTPYRLMEERRIVHVTSGERSGLLSFPDLVDVQRRNSSFDQVFAASSPVLANLEARGVAHLETAAGLTHNFFSALGIVPLAGQLWPSAADETLAKRLGVIVSEELWERRFNRDPHVIGSLVVVNGVTLPVAAVVPTTGIPAHFIGHSHLWIALSDTGEVGNPWALTETSRGAAWLKSWGTLRPSVDLDQAAANLRTVSSLIAEEHPSVHERGQLSAATLPRYLLRYDRATVVVSLTVLAIILATFLVAVSNASLLASLQIFRRAVDFKIKSALGASRRQLHGEVAVVCTGLGLLLIVASSVLSYLLLRSLPLLGASALFPNGRSNLDLAPTLIGGTIAVAAIVAVWLWIVQAVALTSINAHTLVRDARQHSLSASISARFLLLQGALSITLMFPAAVHLKSSRNTEQLPLGFAAENLLIVDLDLRDRGHNPKSGTVYLQRIYSEFENSPRFTAIGAAQRPPLETLMLTRPFVNGRRSSTSIGYSVVGVGYFDGLGVNLLGGRDFNFDDDDPVRPVTIVNEAMAQKFWPGDNAVGRDLVLFPGATPSRIIGVVQNFRSDLMQDRQPVAFIPMTLSWSSRMSLYLRFNGPAAGAVREAEAILLRNDPLLPLRAIKTFEQELLAATQTNRTVANLSTAFALFALSLVCMGTYAVNAFIACQRRHEFAIRMAVGATHGNLLALLTRRYLLLWVGAALFGVLGGGFVTRLWEEQLIGVTAFDPGTVAMCSIAMLSISFVSVYLSSRLNIPRSPYLLLRA